MKIVDIVYFMFVLFLTGCTFSEETDDGLIQIDVNQVYQEKELNLKNIADVEYVYLESNDDYIFQGGLKYITKTTIAVYDQATGSFLFFSKNGQPISKFNCKGDGPKEYVSMREFIYDEKAKELFVLTEGKIIVYSSLGVYQRSIVIPKDAKISEVVNCDDASLLLRDENTKSLFPFLCISKIDGSVLDGIELPQRKDIILAVVKQNEESISIIAASRNKIVKYDEGFLLTDHSIDTVFYYKKDKGKTPILVRTPSIQSMSPYVYLNSFIETGDYQFFQKITVQEEENYLPKTYLMRDKKTGEIYKQKIIFDAFRGKQIDLCPQIIVQTDDEKVGYIDLDIEELTNAYKNGYLSGELEEITKNAGEEGNNICMLIHFK